MPKKVYRSLFDADDVYEVEELTDHPDISESGIAAVKTEDAKSKKDEGGPTLEGCWDAIKDLSAKFDAAFGTGGSAGKPKIKDGNEPATGMEVEPLKMEIDKSEPINAQDSDDEDVDKDDEGEDKDGEKASKDVKDAYSGFTRVGEKKVMDTATATQVAFQSRYDKVANK